MSSTFWLNVGLETEHVVLEIEHVVFEFEQFVYCINGEYGEYCISDELDDSSGECEDINGDESIEF